MLDWNFIASQIATIAFDIVYFGAIIGTIVVIILDNRNPVKTMAWILILMFLPIVGLVFYFGTCIVTPVFAKIAYPQIAEQVCAYAPLANLSQILCFVGSFLLTVVLTLTGNRWQMIVQSFYAVAFLVCSVLFCHLWGFGGFIAGILLANLLRLVFTITIGLHFAGKNQKAGV